MLCFSREKAGEAQNLEPRISGMARIKTFPSAKSQHEILPGIARFGPFAGQEMEPQRTESRQRIESDDAEMTGSDAGCKGDFRGRAGG